MSSSSSGSKKGRIALNFAKAQLGERYRFAGKGPNAWDCSGLTMMAWRKAGVRLPHHADNQRKVGKRVSRSNLKVGDLVYFYHPIHHVGIYAGNGRVIHAPNPRKRVEYSKISYDAVQQREPSVRIKTHPEPPPAGSSGMHASELPAGVVSTGPIVLG